MAAGDIYRLSIEGVSGATLEQLVCTHHYRQEDNLIGDEPGSDLVDAWLAENQAAFRATFSANAGITKFTVRGVSGDPYVYERAVSLLVGTLTGDDLPPQVSALISWRTGLPGRSYRGRTYLWLATEGVQSQGLLTSAYQALMTAYINKALYIPIGLTHSAYQLGVWSEALQVFTPCTTGIVRPALATQRRRRVGVGS